MTSPRFFDEIIQVYRLSHNYSILKIRTRAESVDNTNCISPADNSMKLFM